MTSKDHNKHLPTLAPGPGGVIPSKSKRLLPGPKKSSVACLQCKQAKRKCSGGTAPCIACESAHVECVFDESLDRRRKVSAKRTKDELEHYRGLLYSLLESLRSSETGKFNEVVSLIRSNAPLERIASIISATTIGFGEISPAESPRTTSPDPPRQSSLLEAQPADYGSRVSLEKLCDIPLFQIRAKPWTSVTEDDHLVSHLVSLYFTWVHPFLLLFDQKIVLDHMAAGSSSPEVCTRFLVNSILAVASAYSDYAEVLTIPGDINSRGRLFYMEAEKLWRSEEGRATLPNIQGVALMAHFLKCQGKSRHAWLMLKQGVQLAQDFGLFQTPKAFRPPWKEMPEDIQHVSAVTAWGVFILNSQVSMELQTIANLTLPILKPFERDSADRDIWWTPYPRSNQVDYAKKPALFGYIMTEIAKLTEVIVDIQGLLFDKAFYISIDGLWTMANELHHRLQLWLKSLPDVLNIDDQPLPQVLFLRIKYHQTIMSLFAPFSYHANFRQAGCIQLQSAREIAQYTLIQYQCYGLKQTPSHFMEATNSSILVLLWNLDDDGCRDTFIQLCRVMVAFSKRFKSAKVMIDGIHPIIEKSQIVLPPEALGILEYVEPGESPEP